MNKIEMLLAFIILDFRIIEKRYLAFPSWSSTKLTKLLVINQQYYGLIEMVVDADVWTHLHWYSNDHDLKMVVSVEVEEESVAASLFECNSSMYGMYGG